jgi:hypothetical protein
VKRGAGNPSATQWSAIITMALLVAGCASLMATVFGWEMPWAWAWVTGGFAGCGLTLHWWRADSLNLRTVLGGALLLRIILLPFPPLTSDDPFRYLWDGLIQHHGHNPYHHLPSDMRFNGLHEMEEFRRMNSRDYHSVYPPLAQVSYYLAASVRPWGFHITFVLLKLLYMLPELAGIWALSRMVRPRDVMLYAWNPVVILAVVGQAHNEVAMIGFLLLFLYAMKHRKPGAASLVLAAAGLLKIHPFVLFPLAASRLGWRRMWPGILAAVLLAALYLDMKALENLGSSLRLYLSTFRFYSGPFYLLRDVGAWFGMANPGEMAGIALAGLFAIGGLAIWRIHAAKRMSTATAVFSVFALHLFCSRAVQVWYLAVLVSLLPLIPSPWRWPWWWLACVSWGTYLIHVDGTYWSFVWIGWIGWLLGMVAALVYHFRNHGRLRPAISTVKESGVPTTHSRTLKSNPSP